MIGMQQVLAAVGEGEVMVTGIDVIQTDMGEVLDVHMQSMSHPDVLSLTVRFPTEVVGRYDFQEAGAKWQSGWSAVADELKKRSAPE